MATRAISAIIAVALVAGISFFGNSVGLKLMCMVIALLSTIEFRRLMFTRTEWPAHLQIAFVLVGLITYFSTLGDIAWSGIALAIGAAIYFSIAVLLIRDADDLDPVLQICGLSSVGFIYCGLFAGFATKLLDLPGGKIWLLGLMAVVFAGDTLAYLFGRLFGKRKLLEPVSPKKTIEGAMGGLIGSALAGAILGWYFMPERPLYTVIVLALTTGAFAQLGDLFESLLKRVADVKDSGAIMPGHGGILDRIDGLLFSAPVYYVLARFLVL